MASLSSRASANGSPDPKLETTLAGRASPDQRESSLHWIDRQ